ncbi:Uncharacterized protein TPAR_05408 [Tolypocladium paradoxum]|uniref:Uncharacterized protein n=1 Tax=Tolypocladium paradoxum TaxID=94208 RepID=A0A2S4KW22_9HYPO|nr:Uncharacterized protein TPAR_05408 [Tolypocladium paradoxum]
MLPWSHRHRRRLLPFNPSSPPLPPPPPPLLLSRLHCRERLLVNPVYWTNRQLELLQCSFNDPSPAPPTTQSNFTGERNGRWFIGRMFRIWKLGCRRGQILNIVSYSDCPLDNWENLRFFFNGRFRGHLKCNALFLRGDTSAPLIAAYVDRQQLELLRDEALRPRLRRKQGRSIAFALFKIRLKSITPTEPLHDPYIAALLIAVAQRQHLVALEQQGYESERNCILTFSPQVLVSSKDKECMHLYTADISSSFLEMLIRPDVPPPAPTSISIQITVVPYKPYNTLRDRLFALLLPPQSQDVDRKRKIGDEGTQHLPNKHEAEELITCP